MRKSAKWACTLAAAAMLGVAVFGRFYSLDYAFASRQKATVGNFSMGAGLIQYCEVRDMHLSDWTLTRPWSWRTGDPWHWGLASEQPLPVTRDGWNAGVLYISMSSALWLGISVVYPVLFTLMPAALLWYADRRRQSASQCKNCRDDRPGHTPNASRTECGKTPEGV